MAAPMTECFQWAINDIRQKAMKEKLDGSCEEKEENMHIDYIEALESDGKTKVHVCKSVYVYSKVFPVPGYKFGFRARLDLKLLEISLQFRDIYKNCQLDCKSLPMVTYIRKDMDEKDKKDITMRADCGFKEVNGYDDWAYQVYLTRNCFSKDNCNCISIAISVEPPPVARSFQSKDGVLTWTIEKYKEKRQTQLDGVEDFERSPYFYTAPNGYRLMAKIPLSWYSIKVYVCFVTGECDESLPETFLHNVTVTLFNQKNSSKTITASQDSDYTKYRCIELTQSDSIEKEGFIDDDSIALKIEITPLSFDQSNYSIVQ